MATIHPLRAVITPEEVSALEKAIALLDRVAEAMPTHAETINYRARSRRLRAKLDRFVAQARRLGVDV